MEFLSLKAAYGNSRRVFEEGVTVKYAECAPIAQFDRDRKKIAENIEAYDLHEPWIELSQLLSIFHATLARTPCSPIWLYENTGIKNQLKALDPALSNQKRSVDKAVWESLENAIQALKIVRTIEENPNAHIAKSIIATFTEDQDIIITIRNRSLWEETQRALACKNLKNIHVKLPGELRNHCPAQGLILFGPPGLLDYRSQGFLIRSPVAKEISVIMQNHESAGKIAHSLLQPDELVKLTGDKPALLLDFDPKYEPAVFLAQKSIQPRDSSSWLSEIDGFSSMEPVSCLPIALGGNKGIYLKEDTPILVAQVNAKDTEMPCVGVTKIHPYELEVDMLLIRTTTGGGDQVRPYADLLLGKKARHYRELLDGWKRALRKRVDSLEASVVATKLRHHGCRIASEQNVRNWCNSQTIAPKELDETLLGILTYLGMERQHREISEAAKQVRSAYQSAGVQLQKLVLKRLQGLNLRVAITDGAFEIRAKDEGPSKTVFLVDRVGPPVDVAENLTGILFDREK